MRTFKELDSLVSFFDRFEYLKLVGEVGTSSFGHDRYLNQMLYSSARWRSVRNHVIVRDNGCDLAVPGFDITTKINIHHMNPVTVDDIIKGRDHIFEPDFLICTSHKTHMAIHYGDSNLIETSYNWIPRESGDTKLW